MPGTPWPLHLINIVPELKHWPGQGLGTIFRKKQPSVFDFDHSPRAGYGVLQPVSPHLVEENIPQTPDDKRWNLKGLECGVNGDRVYIVEAQPIALEGLDSVLRRQQGLQIQSNDVILKKLASV